MRLVFSDSRATARSLLYIIHYNWLASRLDWRAKLWITRRRDDVTHRTRTSSWLFYRLINSAVVDSFWLNAFISAGTFHVSSLPEEPVKLRFVSACTKDFVVGIDEKVAAW